MKKILNIFGSTGSIGTQALDVIEKFPNKFEIKILCGGSNYKLLAEQIKKFQPKTALVREEYLEKLKNLLPNHKNIYSLENFSFNYEEKVDISLIAISGFNGFHYSWEAAKFSKRLALANKESIICGGEIFLTHVKNHGTEIIPIDSEHNTIFQLIDNCKDHRQIDKIIITASGGPFLGWEKEKLKNITPDQAASHPKWKMGKKISIDSATLMNKALELIECFYLFGTKNLEAIIHPQSIIHGILELKSGMMLAGMAQNDMRIHIAHSLLHPKNLHCITKKVNLFDLKKLEFYDINSSHFPFIKMAHQIIESYPHLSILFNALGEVAVDLFIHNKISFLDIGPFVEENFSKYMTMSKAKTFEDLIEIDRAVKNNISIYKQYYN